jgi:hypothetical protein
MIVKKSGETLGFKKFKTDKNRMTGHRGAAALAKLGPGGKIIERLVFLFFLVFFFLELPNC